MCTYWEHVGIRFGAFLAKKLVPKKNIEFKTIKNTKCLM